MFKDPSLTEENESIESPFSKQIYPILNQRRSDSAEKYFDWASKTNRKLINNNK